MTITQRMYLIKLYFVVLQNLYKFQAILYFVCSLNSGTLRCIVDNLYLFLFLI